MYAYYVEQTRGVHARFLMAPVSMHAGSSNIVPVLAPVPVADLRSGRSRIQCPFRQTFGKAHRKKAADTQDRVLTHFICLA